MRYGMYYTEEILNIKPNAWKNSCKFRLLLKYFGQWHCLLLFICSKYLITDNVTVTLCEEASLSTGDTSQLMYARNAGSKRVK